MWLTPNHILGTVVDVLTKQKKQHNKTQTRKIETEMYIIPIQHQQKQPAEKRVLGERREQEKNMRIKENKKKHKQN